MCALHFQFHLSNLFPLIYTKIWKLEIYTGNKLSKKERFQGNGNWIVKALNKKNQCLFFLLFLYLINCVSLLAGNVAESCCSLLFLSCLFCCNQEIIYVFWMFQDCSLQMDYKESINISSYSSLHYPSFSLRISFHYIFSFLFPSLHHFLSLFLSLSFYLSFLHFAPFFPLLSPNLVSILHSLFSPHWFSLCSFAFLSLLFSTLSLFHFLTSIFSSHSLLHFFPLLSYTFVFLAHLSNFVKKESINAKLIKIDIPMTDNIKFHQC